MSTLQVFLWLQDFAVICTQGWKMNEGGSAVFVDKQEVWLSLGSGLFPRGFVQAMKELSVGSSAR
eukprot:762792-Hanusia_phi.AAC.3